MRYFNSRQFKTCCLTMVKRPYNLGLTMIKRPYNLGLTMVKRPYNLGLTMIKRPYNLGLTMIKRPYNLGLTMIKRPYNLVLTMIKRPYNHGLTMIKRPYNHGLTMVIRGREVERRPRNLEVPSSIPGSGCQLWDFFIGSHIRREYWCSSQEAESREISISCKNLFLNRCKINMFKLNNGNTSV